MTKVLLYGGKGWIGSQIVDQLQQHNVAYIISNSRIEDIDSIKTELTEDISHVICTVGRTKGSVNGQAINSIDYLEYPGKLVDNVRDNLMAPVALAQLCQQRNIHLTYLGTGCIFSAVAKVADQDQVADQDEADPNIVNHKTVVEKKYDESSKPDFFGSSYSIVKGWTDQLMSQLYNQTVLNVRIRMPITRQPHSGDFITKITHYPNICSMDNSMTVLDDLIPLLVKLVLDRQVGTINLVNPGYINHNQILEIYKSYCDPDHSWNNITLTQQRALLRGDRSNNVLNSDKVTALAQHYGLALPDITTSVTNILKARGRSQVV